MDYFRETFLNKHSNIIASSSLLPFEGSNNYKIFKREKYADLKTLVKNINLTLNNVEKRSQALSLLLLILPQADNALFNEEGEKWFKLCAQGLNSISRDKEKIATIKIMTFILKKSFELKELRTKIAKLNNSFLPFMYSAKVQGDLVQPVMDCLYEYLILFPGESLKYKNDIEKFVCSFLNTAVSSDSIEVESAAKVFAVLPIPRVGASAGDAQERGKQLMQLVTFSHQVLDVLFSGIQESEDYDQGHEKQSIPLETLESAKLLKDPLRLYLSASLIIANTFEFISKFLSSTNTNFINISSKNLLTVVSRVLQVELNMVNRLGGQEMELLSFLLPSLHIRALRLLETIILSKAGQFFYGIIGEQLVATLKSANQVLRLRKQKKDKKENTDTQKENVVQGELIKVWAYKVLTTLIQISDGRHHLPADLLAIVKHDVEISKDSVRLKAVKGSELDLNLKKKKKKGYSVSENDIRSDDIITNAELSLQAPCTVAALKFIYAMFSFAHHSMQRFMIKGLLNTLLQLLRTSLGGVYVYPKVKVAYYRALIAYACYPHPLYPLDYNSVHNAFVRGCDDTDRSVWQICKEGLSTMSFIMANPQISKLADFTNLQVKLGFENDQANINTQLETEIIEDDTLDSDTLDSETEDKDTDINNIDSDVENADSDSDSASSDCQKESTLRINSDNDVIKVNGINSQLNLEKVLNSEDRDHLLPISNNDKEVERALTEDSENEIFVTPNENEAMHAESSVSDLEVDLCQTVKVTPGKKRKLPTPTKSKAKKIDTNDTNTTVQEMLSSFVEADPDSE